MNEWHSWLLLLFGGCDPRCGVSIAYDDGGNTKRDTVSHIKTPFLPLLKTQRERHAMQITLEATDLEDDKSAKDRPIYDSGETRCLWENHALFLLWGQGPSANTRWDHHHRTSPAEAHCVYVYLQPDPIFSHSLENDDDDDRKPRRKILNRRQRVLQRSCSLVHSISGIGIGGGEEERDMTSSLIYVNYRKRRKERLKPQAAL